MGIGFLLLIYIIALTLATFPFAALFSFQKWIRKDLGRNSRFIRIYIASYSWFAFGVIGMGALSSLQGYDIGFGDFWEREIGGQFSACSVDNPYSMQLCKSDTYLSAEEFALIDETLIARIDASTKCYNINTGSVISCPSSTNQLDFVTPAQYYDKKITQRSVTFIVWLILDFVLVIFVALKKDRFKFVASKMLNTSRHQ